MSAAATLKVSICRTKCLLSVSLVSRHCKPIRCWHGPSRELLDLEREFETGATFGAAQLVEVRALNGEARSDGVACKALGVYPD